MWSGICVRPARGRARGGARGRVAWKSLLQPGTSKARSNIIIARRPPSQRNQRNRAYSTHIHTRYGYRSPYAPYQLPAYHRYSTTWTSSTEHGPNRHHRNLTHNCTPASGISLFMAPPYARSEHAKCLQLYTDQISCLASLTSHIVGSLRSFERVGICSDHHWSSTAVRVGESASTAKVVESTNFPCHCPTS